MPITGRLHFRWAFQLWPIRCLRKICRRCCLRIAFLWELGKYRVRILIEIWASRMSCHFSWRPWEIFGGRSRKRVDWFGRRLHRCLSSSSIFAGSTLWGTRDGRVFQFRCSCTERSAYFRAILRPSDTPCTVDRIARVIPLISKCLRWLIILCPNWAPVGHLTHNLLLLPIWCSLIIYWIQLFQNGAIVPLEAGILFWTISPRRRDAQIDIINIFRK